MTLPMTGTSTAISNTSDSTNSQGAIFSQTFTGT
jgi:hypothetical protein